MTVGTKKRSAVRSDAAGPPAGERRPGRRSIVRVGVATLGTALMAGCAAVHHEAPSPAVGSVRVGTASWYGAEFQGRPTASGERFDQHALTAAARSYPIGARLRVTNVANGRSTIVRVNDRGPFVRGRVLDLSHAAARNLDMVRSGTARVCIETLDQRSPRSGTARASMRPARRTRRRRATLIGSTR